MPEIHSAAIATAWTDFAGLIFIPSAKRRQALNGDEQSEFGFGIGAQHAADVAQFLAKGLQELWQIHAVEVSSQVIHVTVELGMKAGGGHRGGNKADHDGRLPRNGVRKAG